MIHSLLTVYALNKCCNILRCCHWATNNLPTEQSMDIVLQTRQDSLRYLELSFKGMVFCNLYLNSSSRGSLFARWYDPRLEINIKETWTTPLKASPISYTTWGPFLEGPGNLTSPKSYFEIKVLRKVECVLTFNKVHFVSLADNFTVKFSNLLNLPSGMEKKTA